MIDEYIKKYRADFDFVFCEKRTENIHGITVESDIFIFSKGIQRRTVSHFVFRKEGAVYECDCADIEFPNISLITVNGKKCLCFSKTLYGFVFLNTENLQVEYEYFPEKVFDDEESFIVVEARNLGDLIIFDGCYWACPDGIYAYDHGSKRFFDLSGEYGFVYDIEHNIADGVLTLSGRALNEEEMKMTFSENDIKDLINKKGTLDF